MKFTNNNIITEIKLSPELKARARQLIKKAFKLSNAYISNKIIKSIFPKVNLSKVIHWVTIIDRCEEILQKLETAEIVITPLDELKSVMAKFGFYGKIETFMGVSSVVNFEKMKVGSIGYQDGNWYITIMNSRRLICANALDAAQRLYNYALKQVRASILPF